MSMQIREPGRPYQPRGGFAHEQVSIPSKSGNPVDHNNRPHGGTTRRSQSLPNQGTRSTDGRCIGATTSPVSSQSLPNQGTRSTREKRTPREARPVSIPSKSGNPVDLAKMGYAIILMASQSLPNQGTRSTGGPTWTSVRSAWRLNPFQIREPGRPELDRASAVAHHCLNPFQIREPGRPPAPHTVLKGLPTVSIPSKSGNPVDLDTKTINGKTYLSQSLPNQGTRSTSGNTEAQEGTMNSLNPFQIREPGRPG